MMLVRHPDPLFMVSRAVIQNPTLSRATRLQPCSSGQALLKLIMHSFLHLFLFDCRGTWLLSEAGDPGGGLQYLILEDWDRYMNDRILVLEPNHSRACTFWLASSHTALCDTRAPNVSSGHAKRFDLPDTTS